MGAYWGPQQWWKILHTSIVTNGLVLNLDAGNPASYNPNGGGDTYLLLHADGANDSTNFIDSGTYAHTITPTGNAKISTVKSKFGGSSFRADNTSPFILSQLKFPTVTLSGDFTLALWVNFDNINNDQALLGAESGNNQLFRFNADNVSGGLMSYSNSYIFEPTANEISFMQSNQWYYLTMTRSGSIVKTFIDGQLLQTNNNFASTITLNIIGAGAVAGDGGFFNPFTGYIDDVVILDGTCLYTESFTAPVSPYNSGTTWYDLSGNGNNGTLLNGVSYDSANGGSLVFDGIDDYASLPSNFINWDAGQPFTISIWFKSSANGILLGQQKTSIPNTGVSFVPAIYVDSFGKLVTSCFWGGNPSNVSVSSESVDNNLWNNITVTYSGGSQISYLNGVEYATLAKTQNFYTSIYYYFIGSGSNYYWPNNGNAFINANISSILSYNRALTSQEITQNFNALKGRYNL